MRYRPVLLVHAVLFLLVVAAAAASPGFTAWLESGAMLLPQPANSLLGAELALTLIVGLAFGLVLFPGRRILSSRPRRAGQPLFHRLLELGVRSAESHPRRARPRSARGVRGLATMMMSEVPITRLEISRLLHIPRSRLGRGRIGSLKARARAVLARAAANTNVTNMLQNIKTYSGLLDRYSASNSALIYWQDPDATLVHSEKDWNRLKRELNRDPKALAVLVPIGGGRKVSQPEVAHLIERRRKMGWNDARIDSEVQSLLARGKYVPTRSFGVGKVYDAKSLLPGRPLPRKQQLKVSQLYGMAKTYARRFYDVEEGPIGGARGYSKMVKREDGTIKGRIQVLKVPGEQVEPLDTLVHEMAHHQLGHTRDLSTREYQANRGKYEAETQLTSFLVLSHFGVNNKQHSSAYIGQWLRREDQKTLGEQSVARSMNAANHLIQGIDAERSSAEGSLG